MLPLLINLQIKIIILGLIYNNKWQIVIIFKMIIKGSFLIKQ